jgi:exopolyphosphatase/guanosine-5'-triphosphate,3'-diphosphate pyrophosphatase
VALLRVADALDRSHASVVERIRVERRGRQVVVRAVARGEAELELWGLRRKKSLFEELFGVSLEVVVQSTGRDDWEAEVAEPG